MIRGMEKSTTEKITQELDRTYNTVLDFVNEVHDALEEDPEFDLLGFCKADGIYVVAGEKGIKHESPGECGLKKE